MLTLPFSSSFIHSFIQTRVPFKLLPLYSEIHELDGATRDHSVISPMSWISLTWSVAGIRHS